MSIEFEKSETKDNLMRAFAGESQARNRYEMAAQQAKEQKLHIIEQIFTFTANQEKEHAQIFYNHLEQMAGKTIHIDGGYPVDISSDIGEILRMAQHNEYEEHDVVYKDFAKKAKEEGYPQVAASFELIADIEKYHGDRFGKFARWLEENSLFIREIEVGWMCLNCGYIAHGTMAPRTCPVCKQDQGYFIRLGLAPFENKEY